jgi:CheY-like chemotaxis protein
MNAFIIDEDTLVTQREPISNPTILCIDSSPGMLLICQALLEANGYVVLTACSVRAGLELLRQNQVDAVVMDHELDGMSGIKLARELRNIRKGVPLVVFSSSSHPEADYSQIGLFLDKAQGPKALLNAINRICKP